MRKTFAQLANQFQRCICQVRPTKEINAYSLLSIPLKKKVKDAPVWLYKKRKTTIVVAYR